MEKLWTLLSQVHVNAEEKLCYLRFFHHLIEKKKRLRNDCVDSSCQEFIGAKGGFNVELNRRNRDLENVF